LENSNLTFEIIKDIILIIFAAIGSFVALAGLRAWKIQLKGKSDYELAKRLLKNIYSLRQRIEWFRNPIIMVDEIISTRKNRNVSDIGYDDKLDSRFVYASRWKDIAEIYNEINVAKIESEVTWGKEVSNEIEKIRKLLTKLQVSLQQMLSLQRKDNLSDKLSKYLQKYEDIVHDRGTSEEPDDLTKKLDGNIKVLEDLIRPYLK